MKRLRSACAAAVLAATSLGAGCSAEYGGISIYKVDGDAGSVADRSRIRLRQGRVLVFEAHVREADPDRPYQGFEEVELWSPERDVAEVRPVVLVDTWMVIGFSPGETQMQVRVDGDIVESVPIVVEE